MRCTRRWRPLPAGWKMWMHIVKSRSAGDICYPDAAARTTWRFYYLLDRKWMKQSIFCSQSVVIPLCACSIGKAIGSFSENAGKVELNFFPIPKSPTNNMKYAAAPIERQIYCKAKPKTQKYDLLLGFWFRVRIGDRNLHGTLLWNIWNKRRFHLSLFTGYIFRISSMKLWWCFRHLVCQCIRIELPNHIVLRLSLRKFQ